jgi:UDP-N-acetylglucosamine:LPS N-acetylglucosamine transferase
MVVTVSASSWLAGPPGSRSPGVVPPVLILSGSIGDGHDTVAAACAAGLGSIGVAATTLDCMAMLGSRGQQLGERVFRSLLRSAPIYDAFHFSQLRAGTRLARGLEAAAARRVVPALQEQTKGQDTGLLLSVFATGAGASARVTSGLSGWHSVVVCTDATAHRFWVQPGVDRYLVSSVAVAATVQQYEPRADVRVLPPPVRAPFFTAPGRSQARQALGLPDDGRSVILLTAGGWGLGPVAQIGRMLTAEGHVVVAVAGHNNRLETQLRRLEPGRHDGVLVPYGFTSSMPELMAAADVVVTSTGQTVHEARVVGRPLVLVDVVPGHGRENLLLELAAGGARAATPDPRAVAAAVAAALDEAVPAAAWPVASPEEWQRLFVEAVGDLLPTAGST